MILISEPVADAATHRQELGRTPRVLDRRGSWALALTVLWTTLAMVGALLVLLDAPAAQWGAIAVMVVPLVPASLVLSLSTTGEESSSTPRCAIAEPVPDQS